MNKLKLGLAVASLTVAGSLFAEIPNPEPTFLTPGLLQGRVAGDANFTDSILTSDIPLRRELGPGMGLITDKGGYLYNNPTYYQSPIDAVKTAWAENVTFIYKGMIYLDASKLYVFGARIDDSSFLKIGETVLISSSSGGGCHLETYAPAYTGWYPVEIRCGNGGGWAGANPYCNVGNLGFCYLTVDAESDEAAQYQSHRKDSCDDITATWTQLIDDGTGSLFGTSPQTGLLDAVQVTFIGKDGQDLRASVRADIAEKVNIYAWYGSVYGGIDKGVWEHEQWIGRTTGTAGETLSAAFGLPEGTKYVRFVAIGAEDGTHKWAGTTYEVDSIGPIVFSPQVTCTVDAESATTFGVDVKVDVTYPGFGAKDWTAVLTYGEYGRVEVSGTGAEAKVISLANLLGGSTIPATVTVTTDTEKTTVIENVELKTAFEPSLGLLPGLLQGKLEGAINTTDGLSASTIPVRRELGPVMGLYSAWSSTAYYESDIDGEKLYWGDDTTYLYVGRIWLDMTKTYAFGGRNDDSLELSIDGEPVLQARNDNSMPNCVHTTYEPTATGWHAIEIRSGNGGGLAGANPYCPIGYKGIVYNTEGKADHYCQNTHEDEDWWIPLKDTGDATLLATSGVTETSDQIAFKTMERRPASFVAQVDLKMFDPVRVYAWTGPTYGGADEAAWATKSGLLTTKSTTGLATDVRIRVPLAANDKFVRLVAVSTVDGSVVWTSPTVPLDGLTVKNCGLVISIR